MRDHGDQGRRRLSWDCDVKWRQEASTRRSVRVEASSRLAKSSTIRSQLAQNYTDISSVGDQRKFMSQRSVF
jgi:hypothetical protein